ncbi:hypothetical protein QUF49_02665 [Fictibacillus sp. b24]|uniref:hypothetical protein n=1 Tax=Fictibacillus sp. b24 TaxID=3055863 RepID=UPI0025A250B3|nr:hypothetical protein [Fictibacillus sp. b24]MDM5314878.1 hypothetical protein [Fictibacillus sp. b24]
MKDEIKYPFGFLLTRKHFENRYNWREFSLPGEWTLYFSPKNEFVSSSSNAVHIAILGYFFDIRNGNLKEDSIIDKLKRSLEQSNELFLDEISYLSGRFLIILSQNGKLNLFHDVSGLRSVCYHSHYDVVASHDSLVSEVVGDTNVEQVYFKPSEISFSYHTRYKSIEKLIPNMTYEVNTRTLERYYPTKDFPSKSKEEIKTELKQYLSETVKWVRRSHYTPILSLTGGGDSRTSLAILKPIIRDLETFTYMKDTSNASDYAKKTFLNDKKIVTSIVDNLNLKHRFFEISTDECVDPEVIKTIKHNVLSNHGLNLANDYYNLYGKKDYLHIRSTALFNVGKYIFQNSTLKIKEWNTQLIAKNVQKWTLIEDEQQNIEHLDHLLNHAQLTNWYNYNPLELLFVSYRLIQWHSGVVGESDIAFNTMLLLNSRQILDLMLSYPIEERNENKLFNDLIEDLWPVLNYWDINSTENLKTKYIEADKQKERLAQINKQLFQNIITPSTSQSDQLTRTYDNQGVVYKFQNQDIQSNDSYTLTFNLSGFNDDDILCFTTQLFYNNPKGRDKITVTSNFLGESDLLDLFGKREIRLTIKDFSPNEPPYIKILHHQATSTRSWVEASRIWVGDFSIV